MAKLGDEHQMYMHGKYTVSTSSDVMYLSNKPTILEVVSETDIGIGPILAVRQLFSVSHLWRLSSGFQRRNRNPRIRA